MRHKLRVDKVPTFIDTVCVVLIGQLMLLVDRILVHCRVYSVDCRGQTYQGFDELQCSIEVMCNCALHAIRSTAAQWKDCGQGCIIPRSILSAPCHTWIWARMAQTLRASNPNYHHRKITQCRQSQMFYQMSAHT